MRLFIVSLSLFLLLPLSSFAASPLVLEGSSFASLASWVAETAGKSVVVPDAMSFKVWLRSPVVNPAASLALLRSVAYANGWTMTEKGGIISFILTPDEKPFAALSAPAFAPLAPAVFVPPPEIVYYSAIVAFHNRPASSLLAVATSLNSLARVSLAPDNSLSIAAPLDVLERLQRDLPTFDTPLTRYRVEAIISEELKGNSTQIGVNGSLINPSGVLSMVNVGSTLAGPGVLAQLISIGDFSGIFAFLSSSTDFNVMSTPYLLTDDGEKGILHVGDNVPIVTGSTITTNGQTLITYNRQDVGIILSVDVKKVGDRVRLSILQEASSVSPSTISGQVVTSQRKITTTSTVLPGEVIDLGGLVTDTARTVKTGVPWLRDLPFFGVFFRGQTVEQEYRTLRVFLRVVPA